MKNLLASWFRSLTAFENTPVKQEFSIADPTSADPKGLSTVTLAVAPSDGQSPTMVSLYFEASGVKLFEKKYKDDHDAQTEVSAMANDLNEAATLSKEGKMDEAKNLVSSLIEKYKRSSDTLVQPSPTPTMTQASQESLQYKGWAIHKRPEGDWMAEYDVMSLRADSLDTLKAKIDNKVRQAMSKSFIKKQAGITMQNLFFDTVNEAMDFQKKMKDLQGPEGSEGAEGKPLWEQMGNEEVAPSNESKTPEEDNELAPPSLSFDRIEKEKAKSDKDIGKRIKEQVKTEVESALEQKSASVFGPDQEELVDALRKNGRNWDEIKKIFTKELSYNEDDTVVFLDSIRQKEEAGAPAEGLPMPPKPPEDLVSPETHDKLVKEIEDKTEPKPESLPLADEIARADNTEIRKVAVLAFDVFLNGNEIDTVFYNEYADPKKNTTEDEVRRSLINHDGYDPRIEVKLSPKADTLFPPMGKFNASKKTALNPLQEPPAVGQTPGQPLTAPVEENPTFDAPTPAAPESTPEPEFLEAPKEGDRVYVMGDYETGEGGFEGTMVSEYTTKGDKYAVISKDDGDNTEVALHRVVKASQKKVAQVYYEKVAGPIYCTNSDCKRKATVRLPEGNYCEKHAPAEKKAEEDKGFSCYRCGQPVTSPSTYCSKCIQETKPEQKEADLEVEGKANEDVIRMFISDSFPKDKMPVWGTNNLKITKYPNGWALVNYQTPILYRSNGSDVVVFNTHKYSVTTSKIQSQIRRNFTGQSVKETDEAGIYSAIDQSNLAVPEPEFTPELQSLHESALKLQAELEHEGEIAIYFHKEGIEKQAAGDSAFEANGWCRVWIQDIEIESDKRYSEILKVADENARIQGLKDLAKELAREALRSADQAAGKVGVQAWFESLTPSDHDRIDWVALANPQAENVESSLKQAADPVPPTEGPKEVPTTHKVWEKAPKGTDREKALPATVEQSQLVKDVESSLSSLEAIKSLVTQAKAKLAEEIRQIEEKGGRVQMEAEVNDKIQRLAKLVEATQNQMIAAGDTMVRLVQETKEHPFRPSDKWKVEKLTERLSKYEDAAKYLKQAEDGAQHLATSEEVRELYFFPRKSGQSMRLSKKANFLDTLDQVYNSVLEALKLVVGNEPEKELAAV